MATSKNNGKGKATSNKARTLSTEAQAVRQAVRDLKAIGEHEQAKNVLKAYGLHKAGEKAAQRMLIEREKADKAAKIVASLPFEMKTSRTGVVSTARGVLVSMPNRQGTLAYKINQALIDAIDNGKPITLTAIADAADCTVRRVLGHCGTAKSAINGMMHKQDMHLVIGDHGAYIKADGEKHTLYEVK